MMSIYIYWLNGLTLLFTFLFIGGCVSTIPKEDRTKYAHSILDKEVIAFDISSLSFQISNVRNQPDVWLFRSKDKVEEEKAAQLKIKETHQITSPLGGVKEAFFQSLSETLVSGEFVNLNSPDLYATHVDGWIGFTDTTWHLLGVMSGYRLDYKMHADIYYDSGRMNSDEELYVRVWMKSCGKSYPLQWLTGYPLDTWLENDGEKIKETISDISKTCGETLAQDLMEFLGH